MDFADFKALSFVSYLISISRVERPFGSTPTIPLDFMLETWDPPRDVLSSTTSTPAICSASSIDCFTASFVASMFTITPLRTPCDGFFERPITSMLPSESISAITVLIKQVPISRPTIRRLKSFLSNGVCRKLHHSGGQFPKHPVQLNLRHQEQPSCTEGHPR